MSRSGKSFDDEIAQSRSMEILVRAQADVEAMTKKFRTVQPPSAPRKVPASVSEEREGEDKNQEDVKKDREMDEMRTFIEKEMKAERLRVGEEIRQLKQTNASLSESLRKTKLVVEETLPELEKAVAQKERNEKELQEKKKMIDMSTLLMS